MSQEKQSSEKDSANFARGPSVFAKLPRAGLANRLLVWGKAAVFAETNGLPLYTNGWGHIHLGPILRRETTARYYGNFFDSETIIGRLKFLYNRWFRRDKMLREPPAACEISPEHWYVFDTVPSSDDYFIYLRGQEKFIKRAFSKMVKKTWHDKLDKVDQPFIALHVRRGDFRNAGFALTGEEYFVDVLNRVRKCSGLEQAIVFSDARREELPLLSSIANVSFSVYSNEILDLLQMSKSHVLVTSLKSTFGYWAGFVSDASLILDPRHEFGSIRKKSDDKFEGSIEQFEKFCAGKR